MSETRSRSSTHPPVPAHAPGAGPAVREPRDSQLAGSECLERACSLTVDALGRALELHDYRRGLFAETAAHCARVTRIALLLAGRVAPALACDRRLAYGFRLHDVGLIGVSDSILQKPGSLTPAELDELREHPLLGERIVAPVAHLGPLVRQVIGAHHERWDGSGYPRHLEGEQIPLPARIFAFADAYDSLTSDQPHRRALPLELVCDEVEAQAGVRFDPALAPAFLELVREGLRAEPEQPR